ncbi:MAG: hypothetical protein SOY63_05630, partial [Alloprevotella sp.]|nr:hypothetical protein [Alloprevotella sp.]
GIDCDVKKRRKTKERPTPKKTEKSPKDRIPPKRPKRAQRAAPKIPPKTVKWPSKACKEGGVYISALTRFAAPISTIRRFSPTFAAFVLRFQKKPFTRLAHP